MILLILTYNYYNKNNLNNISLQQKVFSIDSDKKTNHLNIYNADKTKDNAAVLVELKKKGVKKNIYWQPNTSWAYIVWKSEDIVYINGRKVDLSKNKQYDERDHVGESFYGKEENDPLYLAILKNDQDDQKIIKQIKKQSDKNYADAQGNTLMMIASYTGNLNILRELGKRGGNINQKNHEGQGVLEFTIRGDMPEKKIIKMLNEEVKLGANITKEIKDAVLQPWKYRWKSARCNYEVFNWVNHKLNKQIDKELTKEQKTLMDAARGMKTKATKTEAKLTDQDGNSLLMIAAGYGNQKLVKTYCCKI